MPTTVLFSLRITLHMSITTTSLDLRNKEKTTTDEFRVLLYLFVTVPRIDKTYQASPSNNSPNGNPSG